MTSGRMLSKWGRVLGCFILSGFLYSCQISSPQPGDWAPIEFSSDKVQTGPQGGHYEISVLNYGVQIIYISDHITKRINEYYLTDGLPGLAYQMDEVTVYKWSAALPQIFQMEELSVFFKSGKEIEIDVAPSEERNHWTIGVSSGDAYGVIHVVQEE